MRIVIIEGALRENGGLRLVLAMARRWMTWGEPVQYFVLQRVEEEARVEFAAPKTYGQPNIGRLRYSLPLVFLRLLKAVRHSDVVVSASETGFGLLLGKAAAVLLRRPFVVVVQADLRQSVNAWVPNRLQRLTLAVHRRVDAAICVGEGLRRAVLETASRTTARTSSRTASTSTPSSGWRQGPLRLPSNGLLSSGSVGCTARRALTCSFGPMQSCSGGAVRVRWSLSARVRNARR